MVLAAAGYPDTPKKGDVITGIPKATEDCKTFHAGTTEKDGHAVTSGGRVLCVTGLGVNVKEAADIAYRAVASIRFDGMQFRKDIGHRAIHRK